MPRSRVPALAAIAALLAIGFAHNAEARMKVTVTKQYRGTPGYGFLPGYEPPGRVRRDHFGQSPYVRDATYPWFGWPGYYRGRWNGGGFGPCYTKTPIGMVWNCG
jgi:hypothetical protein